MARTAAVAGALFGALGATALPAGADAMVCGGQGLPNCPQVTYVTPEYLLPDQPATVTLEGTDMEGVTAASLAPGGQSVPVHHVAPGTVTVDVPGVPAGNYFFQLDLAQGPAPLVDGGGVVVDPSGGPAGPRAPRPDASSAAAAAPVTTPPASPTPAPTPAATAAATPGTPAVTGAAAVSARLPERDDTVGTVVRIVVGVALACGAVEALNLLNRRRRATRSRPGRGATGPMVLDPAVVEGGNANRFCASCGTGGAALVRWRFDNGGGIRVSLCRRCR